MKKKYIFILIAIRLMLLILYLFTKLSTNGTMVNYSWWFILTPEFFGGVIVIIGILGMFVYNTWKYWKL